MAAQKGSDMLLKVGDGASPEVFTALAGVRTKTLVINAEQVDVSSQDSVNKFRELLAGAGMKSVSTSGSGVFKDETVDATLRTEMFTQAIKSYQVVIPGFGTFEGLFQMTQLQYAGEHNGEVTWDIALESAADIAFTAS